MLGRVHRDVKSIRRSKEIVDVLIKHGFGHLLERLDLKIPLMKKTWGEEVPVPERLRMVLEELGPTFVKFGQLLSMRPDILPEKYMLELKKLQDSVPGFPYEYVEETVERELGDKIENIYTSFQEKPIAAASIAQVHKAEVASEKVVVKVKRPGIDETIDSDLDILFNLARLAEKHLEESRLYDPVGLVDSFAKSIRDELDFTIEGRNAERFAKNFEGDEAVHIPKIYWDYSCKGVLTLEYIKGLKVGELPLDMPGDERKKLAQLIGTSYLKQVFVDGFFHADPHEGNIVVVDTDKIAFFDFGIVGVIDPYLKERMANLFIALIQKDVNKIVDEFAEIGVVGDETDMEAFRSDLSSLIEKYYGTKLEEVNISQMLSEILSLSLKHRIKMPPNLSLLLRTIIVLEGMCRNLSPEFNMTEVAKPFVEDMVSERMSPVKLLSGLFERAAEVNDLLKVLPRRVNRILSQLERGKLLIDLEHKGLSKMISEIDIASNRLSMSLVISSIIIASSVIMLAGKGPTVFDLSVFGVIGYLIAGVLGMWLVISIIKRGRF